MKALALGLLVALPAAGSDGVPEEHRLTVEGCRLDLGACVVRIEEIKEYTSERARLAAELERLKKSCTAKLEVIEPPKKAIPIDPKTNRGS